MYIHIRVERKIKFFLLSLRVKTVDYKKIKFWTKKNFFLTSSRPPLTQNLFYRLRKAYCR